MKIVKYFYGSLQVLLVSTKEFIVVQKYFEVVSSNFTAPKVLLFPQSEANKF